jgi:hypothetical protein
MHKFLIAALAGISAALATSGLALAQMTSATPTPSPEPSSSPALFAQAPSEQQHHHRWKNRNEYWLAGDYVYSPNVNNQFNPHGDGGRSSFAGRAGIDYTINRFAILLEGDYQSYLYQTPGGGVTSIGGTGSTNVPSFLAHNTYWDAHLGIGFAHPRVFLAASYLQQQNNYGFPNIQGFGFGIEKVADFDTNRIFSPYGSFYYYPQVGSGTALQYSMYTYQAGIEFHVRHDRHIPAFLDIGYVGNHANTKLNSPSSFSSQGVYTGLGFHF